MVKDTFVNFPKFIATVEAIEQKPFEQILAMWVIGMIDIDIKGKIYKSIDYKYRRFLPYPYQRSYISKLINWQLGYKTIKDKYRKWISDIMKKDSDTIDITDNSDTIDITDKLIHTQIPIFFDETQRPTFEQFFEERIVPFLKSSISEEEYNMYQDHNMLIGLERNTHVILDTSDDPQLKIGRIEYEQGDSIITIGCESVDQYYVKYADGHCVFLGDVEYNMYPEEIIKAQLKVSGTAYLFDNENLE